MKRMTAQFFKLNCNKDILYVNSSLILLWPTAILLVTILQLFLPYFKPSSLQDVLYEEQPNAKRLYSVNEEQILEEIIGEEETALRTGLLLYV